MHTKVRTAPKAIKYIIKDTDIISGEILSMRGAGNSGSDSRKYVLRVRDLPSEDKPREKLKESGPESLSVVELLSIVLNNGTTKEGVLEMASRLVSSYGEKNTLNEKDPEKLSKELDIPIVKAYQIVACGELGRRLYQKSGGGLAMISNASDVFDYAKDMTKLQKEQLRGLYLNSHNRVIHDEVISVGTINSSIIHPREVFRPALQYGAVAVVLAHNHPSGDSTPSSADIEITKQLVDAGKMLGIHILDHVIIAGDRYTSVPVDY